MTERARRMWDITPTVSSELAVWPGDTRPRREVLLDRARGDHLTLSTLHATVHLGAHADAPSHYGTDAPSIEAVDPARYVGPCRVFTVRVGRGARVGPDQIPADLADSRVLLRTDSYPNPKTFSKDFAGLEVATVHAMADRGVRLIGLDTPSVDLFTSKELPAHQACLERDIGILEGLVLGGVSDGRYELVALPLKLEGFDASPVRAILRALE